MNKVNVINRFLEYVKIDTQSDENSASTPSTEKQHNLAAVLAKELEGMGASSVYYDTKHCYVYAKIPANRPSNKTLGFISHMDTSPEMNGKGVNPQIVNNYDGKNIPLGKYTLSPTEFPELLEYVGKDLITSDGSTLLGADDKAGVAEIMAMAEYLLMHPEVKHGEIAIAFTPDEEIGAGVDYFDIERFAADYAYTVDGGGIGEIEYENFNAASAKITITGQNVHPGEAKGKMLNASRIAGEFDRRLPQNSRPENTSGYEGFFHLTEMSGDVESACLKYIIRDHDKALFESKKYYILEVAKEMNSELGKNSISVEIKDQYYNMSEKIVPVMFLIDNVKKCMEQLNIVPKVQPIRGGTDGARLSFMGIPCPNICTGGHNYHGRSEYCCIQSMEKITELLILLSDTIE